MKRKFTRGEWFVDENSDFVNWKAKEGVSYPGNICQFFNKNEDHYHNHEANAKLIAAAPDLLEACEKIISLKEIILPPEPVEGVSEEFRDEYVALNSLVTMAENAIKKATE